MEWATGVRSAGHDRHVQLRSPPFKLAWALLALLLLGAAQAQCARGPLTAEVTLPGQFAVYYQQFRSDAAADSAEFYGGVCVAAVGGAWTVIAERVVVGNLSGDIFLEAAAPTLYLEGWRLTAADLVANPETLTLMDAVLVGPDVGGRAESLAVDIATGRFTLTDLVLTGSAFQVEGALATLEGDVLEVEQAGVTTCIGVDPAPLAIRSRSATVALEGREVRLAGGELLVGSLRIPLRDDVTLSDKTLSEFEFPVKVAMVEPSPGAPAPAAGAGLSVRVVGIPLADAVTLEVGGTGLDPDHVALPVALVRAAASDDAQRLAATFGLEAGAPYLDFGLTAAVAPGVKASFGARSGAAPARRGRHEGRAGVEATLDLPALGGSAVAEAFAAVTAVTADAAAAQPVVAGPRLGARLSLSAASQELAAGGVSLGRFALESRVQVTHYPGTWGSAAVAGAVTQWGVRLAPSWQLSAGPVSATLVYDARFTNAASPFGSAVDGLTPLQRATAAVSVAGPLGGGLTGRLGLGASYDPFATPGTPAGVKRLRADGVLELDAAPWTVTLTAAFEAAGLVTAAPGVRSFVTLDAEARRFGWPVVGTHVPYGAFEFGVGAEYDLLAARLAHLEARLGLPVAFDTLELRPFVAVDFAAVLEGGAPGVSGYGLDATFITCCGSVTVGAINDRGRWGASLAVDLERRPGGSGGTSVPTAPAPVVGAGEASGHEDADAPPGIMPDAP